MHLPSAACARAPVKFFAAPRLTTSLDLSVHMPYISSHRKARHGVAMPVKPLEKTRNARLEARVSSAQKDLFQQAATLAGKTLSEFVIESTQQAAAKVLQEQNLIRLSRDEQIAFVSALLSPSEPGPRLRQAAKNYRRKSGV